MMSKRTATKGVEQLQQTVARDFRGGLNTYDSPLNLSTKYSTRLINLYPDSNGRLQLRYGVRLFADANTLAVGDIVRQYYFNTAIIVVFRTGVIATLAADGNFTLRWNNAIAATRPGAPAGWSATTFASFTPFEGSVIICNGTDKPLIMDELYTVNYLADPATGSNVNVPRAKYCATHNGYLILASTTDEPSTLFIGAKGVAGTFTGDPAPNDAVDFATAQFIDVGSPAITGLASFRDSLIVSYNDALLSVKLGTYDEDVHTPIVADFVRDIGALNHDCITAIGDVCYFLNTAGFKSLKRGTGNGLLTATNESTLIGRDIRTTLQKFTPANAEQYVFMVHDTNLQQVLAFAPTLAVPSSRTDNDVFVFCYDKLTKFAGWTMYKNMPYRSACRSREGRIFLSAGAYVYVMANELEPGYTDPAAPTMQPWSDGTYFTDGTGWYEPNNLLGSFSQPWDDDLMWDDDYGWVEYSADAQVPIEFTWWMPWADMREPAKMKESRYLSTDAEGVANFSISMLVDRIPVPAMTMTFRNTAEPSKSLITPSNNDQLYAWGQRFNRMSIRVNGRAQSALSYVSMTMLYLLSGYRR